MTNLKSGVRQAQELGSLQTVNLTEMIDHIGATDFRIVTNGKGKTYLHLVNGENKNYFSIGLGKSVKESDKEGVELIKELINTYVIYTGINEESGKAWFAFGTEPTEREAMEVSLASVLGSAVGVA